MGKHAIIIRGPAGAGKTSTSSRLKEQLPNYVWINVDTFRHMISKDSSDLRRTIARNVGIYFLSEVIKNEMPIIIDEIFHDDYYHRVCSILESSNYRVHTFFLTAPEETLLARNNNRSIVMPTESIRRFAKETKANEGDIAIDTKKYSTDMVVSQILSVLAESTETH